MIPVDDALQLVLALAPPAREEQRPLDEAAGRVLTRAVTSRMTQPPFDASAMDGYAYRHADLGQPLRVIGESAAGRPWAGTATAGTAIRIFTGAAVPAGYDRVELQENAVRDGELLTFAANSDGTNIRARGRDFADGDSFFPRRRLTPVDIGLMAAMNIADVTVARAPQVTILAGGDELVRPGETPREGQIISSNDLAVAAIARAAGAETRILPIARDTEQHLRQSFEQAAGADLLVTIGGVSVGDHDLIGKVAGAMGMERAFYKIAMRPGKPLMAGNIGQTAMIGLPGNPVSAIVCAMIFLRPLLLKMQGLQYDQKLRQARLRGSLPQEGPRQHYLRARQSHDDGGNEIEPFEDQDSSLLSTLAQANALIVRPANDPSRGPGEMVSYMPFPD